MDMRPSIARENEPHIGINADHQFTERSLKEFWSAFSYLSGQEYSMQRFKDYSPTRAMKSIERFETAFPNLYDKMLAVLQSIYGEETIKEQLAIIKKSFEENPKLNFLISDKELVAFEKEMNSRAQGNIPIEHLRTFLSVIYENNTLEEFSAGHYDIYQIDNHPKSLGAKLKMSLPKSWYGAEADGPHVVQKWQPMNGGSNELYMIIIDELFSEFAGQPLKVFSYGGLEQEFLSNGKLYKKYMSRNAGMTMLSYEGRIDGKRIDKMPNVSTQLVNYHAFVVGDKLVQLICKKVFKSLEESVATADYDKLRKTCSLLAESVRFTE